MINLSQKTQSQLNSKKRKNRSEKGARKRERERVCVFEREIKRERGTERDLIQNFCASVFVRKSRLILQYLSFCQYCENTSKRSWLQRQSYWRDVTTISVKGKFSIFLWCYYMVSFWSGSFQQNVSHFVIKPFLQTNVQIHVVSCTYSYSLNLDEKIGYICLIHLLEVPK